MNSVIIYFFERVVHNLLHCRWNGAVIQRLSVKSMHFYSAARVMQYLIALGEIQWKVTPGHRPPGKVIYRVQKNCA